MRAHPADGGTFFPDRAGRNSEAIGEPAAHGVPEVRNLHRDGRFDRGRRTPGWLGKRKIKIRSVNDDVHQAGVAVKVDGSIIVE